MRTMRRTCSVIAHTLLYGFALIGFVTVGVYFAMQFDLLNVRGSIDVRNAFFAEAHKERLGVQGTTTPTAVTATSDANTAPAPRLPPAEPCISTQETTCPWYRTPEWAVVESGLLKDAPLIIQVSKETGVSARHIVAVVVPEQIRFFTSNREVFKRWFEPMKLLGSLSQFSLGVSGIKQETAERIEQYAQDPTSPFYPGDGMASLIAHATGTDTATETFNRLTNEKDHYYSYLYTALYIREVQEQWRRARYDITNNPDIVVTLFNLGFDHSVPKPDPQVGGALVTVGGMSYTYGTLGGLFYHSDRLREVFPE